MKTVFFFFCCRPSTSGPVVYKSQERSEPSIMSERDTMFNEQDRRCVAIQIMFSTDPSYDKRTIASTLKMQIWIATNNRDVPRVMKTKFPAMIMVLVYFQVRATSCYLISSKSAWKSTPKCTWMCWRVWWSPGAIRWPVTEYHQQDLPQHQSQPDHRHPPSIRRAPAGACKKGILPVRDPYRGGDWGWRRLHWIDVSSTT